MNLSFFLVNGPQTLYVNPGLPNTAGYLKSVSKMSLSPSNKNLLIIYSFYIVLNNLNG